MTEVEWFVRQLSSEGQNNFKQVVLDRMLKHSETKEQAEKTVVRFIRGLVGDSP